MTSPPLPAAVIARLTALLRIGVPYRTAIEVAWSPKLGSNGRIPSSYLPETIGGELPLALSGKPVVWDAATGEFIDGTTAIQQIVTQTLSAVGATTNPPATVGFTVSVAGRTVTVTNTSYDNLGRTLVYFWNFGDGTTSTSANPGGHTYLADGPNAITLTVTAVEDSLSASTAQQFWIGAPKRGVNSAGGEFGDPVRAYANWPYDSDAAFAYYAQRGNNCVRIEFKWERMQPALMGPLSTGTEMSHLSAAVNSCTSRGMTVVLNPQNFARYMTPDNVTHVIGDGVLTADHFADFWAKLAAAFKANPLVQFGLVNEPHDLPDQIGVLGANLLQGTNADIETGLGTWAAYTGLAPHTQILTGSPAHGGFTSIEAKQTGTGPERIAVQNSAHLAVQGGLSYYGEFFLRSAVGATGAAAGMDLDFFDSSNNYLTTQVIGFYPPDNSTGWTRQAGLFTAPANAAYCKVSIIMDGANPNEVHYFDDISLKAAGGALTGTKVWERAAQAAVTAIRSTGALNWIWVPGVGYTGAYRYWNDHPTWWIKDPLHRSAPEAHYYFNRDNSGDYDLTVAQLNTYAQSQGFAGALDRAKRQLALFLDGCASRGLLPYLGEIGWPNTEVYGNTTVDEHVAWNAIGDELYGLCDDAYAQVTQWAAGQQWGLHYILAPYTSALETTVTAAVIEAHNSASFGSRPNANFAFTISQSVASFTNTSSDPHSSTLSYVWDFGDGGTSTLTSPSHTYPTASQSTSYTVKLTATNAQGYRRTVSKTVTATPAPPTAPTGEPAAALTIISKGQPIFASVGGTGTLAALTNGSFGGWRSGTDATPSAPVWIAIDLRAIAAESRRHLHVAWNNAAYANYSTEWVGATTYSLPAGYTIQGHPSAGSTAPIDTDPGWTTLVTVANNPRSSRSHRFEFAATTGGTPFNWFRIRVTAGASSNDTLFNHDVSFSNIDIADISANDYDTLLFTGDSITAAGSNVGSGFVQKLAVVRPDRPLVYERGGIGGDSALDIYNNRQAMWQTWLTESAAHLVTIDYGTNDAGSGQSAGFGTALRWMVDQVLSHGKVPILPKIPWANRANDATWVANLAAFNNEIAKIYTDYGSAVLHGPDFFTFYQANPSYIPAGDVHPSNAGGYDVWAQQWANTFSTVIMPSATTAPPAPATPTATAGPSKVAFTAITSPSTALPILSYTITPYVGSTAHPELAVVTSTPGNISITGLTNGTTYTFKVKATNSVGTGPESAASNSITPAAPPASLFSDLLSPPDDAANGGWGSNWSADQSADYKISAFGPGFGYLAGVPGGGNGYPAIVHDVATTNCTIAVDMVWGPFGGDGGGIIARYVDKDNHLLVNCGTSSGGNLLIGIYKRVGGTLTQIGTPAPYSETSINHLTLNDTLKVVLSGTSIIAYVNDVQVCTATLSGGPAGTKVGLSIAEASVGNTGYRNFIVS